MLNRKYQTACGYEPRQHLLKLWAKWCEKICFFLKVDETSISDRGSECWPHDLHRAAQCWSCPFGCVLSVPVCSSYTEAESGASSAAGCDREKASYPGRWAFFFPTFFWCFQWQTMSQYACKHPGLSKQERPEPRPGGYDLKIYGPRGGAVPRLTSLIIDEAHQRVQWVMVATRCRFKYFRARATIRPSWILAPRFQWNRLRIRIRNHGKCWDPEMEIFRFTRGSEGLRAEKTLKGFCPFDSEFGSCPVNSTAKW